MTNPMFYAPALALLIFGAATGALMLMSPATSRRFNYWLTYWPYFLAHGSEERPTEDASRGPEFQYRLRGLLMFLMFSYLAGEVLYVAISGIGMAPAATTRALPQTGSANDLWPQIFMGLIFVSFAFWLLLKPETAHRWALDRLGRLRKEPTRREIRIGAGILALGFLAFGLHILWVGLKCTIIACR
jgi:LPXTG-motif cell wall-anchored protein